MSFRAKRGNLQNHVSVSIVPINIEYPGFSMLTHLTAYRTAVAEIATGAMPPRNDGGYFGMVLLVLLGGHRPWPPILANWPGDS